MFFSINCIYVVYYLVVIVEKIYTIFCIFAEPRSNYYEIGFSTVSNFNTTISF